MPLPRLAWLLTVLAAVVTGLLLWQAGFQGYAALSGAVAASAAINLV